MCFARPAGPLKAVITAQAQAAQNTVDFIQKVGYNTDGTVKTVKFFYNMTNSSSGNRQEMALELPFLALVPIPFLRVRYWKHLRAVFMRQALHAALPVLLFCCLLCSRAMMALLGVVRVVQPRCLAVLRLPPCFRACGVIHAFARCSITLHMPSLSFPPWRHRAIPPASRAFSHRHRHNPFTRSVFPPLPLSLLPTD